MTRVRAQELAKRIENRSKDDVDDGVSKLINKPPPAPARRLIGVAVDDRLNSNLKALASETPGQVHFTVDPGRWKITTVRGRIKRMNEYIKGKGMKDRRLRAFMHDGLIVVTSERVK